MQDTKFPAKQPDAAPQNPYLPSGPPEPLLFEEFQGINTATTRPGVDDKQMFWCDGFIPLGPRRYLRTLYGVGPALYAVPQPVPPPPLPSNFAVTIIEFSLAIATNADTVTPLFPSDSPYFDGGLVAYYPDVSAASSQLVFAGEQQNGSGISTISVTDNTGVTVTDLYTPGNASVFPTSPSYSQDGTKIVFSEHDLSTDPTAYNIYTMNSDGSNLTKIWTDTSEVPYGDSLYPRFNPDASKIVFQIKDATSTYGILQTMNADGSGVTTILDLSGSAISVYEPDWSVDNLIVFVKDDGVTPTFATCDNSGGSVTAITLDWGGPALVQLANPRRLWNGTVFWFLSTDGSLIYLMRAQIDGTMTTALVTTDGSTIPIPDLDLGIGIFP